MQTAMRVAQRLGIECSAPILLHRSQHLSIRLSPSDVVARVLPAEHLAAQEQLHRELAVARHLVEKAAPVVGPIGELSPGPYFRDEMGLTLWPFVEHVAADFDNREHAAAAAQALQRVHDALADFPGKLPSFRLKIDQCRTLLDNKSALPALSPDDRNFLLALYGRLIVALDALSFRPVPIHGDPGAHNVFITSAGARYIDFETVGLGPREWDIGFLPPENLTIFEPVDRDLFRVLSDLRSLCVSVWCWDKPDVPEKREAAEYHLEYLKECFA
jgi:Ser/Thr protein kinase RdoA (MazF antagonist)